MTAGYNQHGAGAGKLWLNSHRVTHAWAALNGQHESCQTWVFCRGCSREEGRA